jgi:glycosyltransferase involved in cell wall biosynthesis
VDRERIVREYDLPEDRVLVFPNHVDVEDYATPSKAVGLREKYGFCEDDFLVLFHGVLDNPHNLGAVTFILEELAPLLYKMAPHVKILIVGARAPRSILEKGAQVPNVSVHSDVPDISVFLKITNTMIAPLLTGGGTKMKILEAFAAQVPVIATPKAIEGLDCLPGLHVLVAKRDAKTYYHEIMRLYEDPSLRKSIATSAFTLVRSKYDVHVAAKLYGEILRDSFS